VQTKPLQFNGNQIIDTDLFVGTGSLVNNKLNHQAVVYVFAVQSTQFVGEKRCNDLTIRPAMDLTQGWNTVKFNFSEGSLLAVESIQPQTSLWASPVPSTEALMFLF
jgi:hypothetical protein